MATNIFPNGKKTWVDKQDYIDTVMASHMNDAYAEIIAIEDTLINGLPVSKGGTGATTKLEAQKSILPDQTSNNGKVLKTDGTNAYWDTESLTSDDRNKLDGIAIGATKTESSITNGNIKINGTETIVYTHPVNHPASIITQDASNRFVTDTEKTNWNGKANATDVYLKTEVYTKTETDTRIQNVVGAAPAALDTLQELATALGNDANFAGSVTTSLSNKVDKVTGKQLTTNDFDNTYKTKLDGIADNATKVEGSTLGYIKINNVNTLIYEHPAMHEASIIYANETFNGVLLPNTGSANLRNMLHTIDNHTHPIATITTAGLMSPDDKAKLDVAITEQYEHPLTHDASMITGLATVATTASYTDLINKPTNATTSTDGFMSSTDKLKLDSFAGNYIHPESHAAMMIEVDVNDFTGILDYNAYNAQEAFNMLDTHTHTTLNGYSASTSSKNNTLALRDGNGALYVTKINTSISTGEPITVNSTTKVENLNADLLDGQHGSYYQPKPTTTNTSYGVSAGFSISTGSYNTALGHQALYSNTASDNTAVGHNALTSNTTGSGNTAVGKGALDSNTIGVYNTALGANALYSNTDGGQNTALGYGTLYSNTASNNLAVGYYTMYSNTTGTYNTAIGRSALYWNVSGDNNTALGYNALNANTASDNTAIGYFALATNTSGSLNVAVGKGALQANSTGQYNTALGANALYSNTASDNTAVGYNCLDSNTSGTENTAIGSGALQANTTSDYNTAVGKDALYSSKGTQNTAIGRCAMSNIDTGSYNTAIGYNAGRYIADGSTANTTSDYSVYLGNATKASADNNQNEIVIGYNATGKGDNTVVLGNTNTIAGYIGSNKIVTWVSAPASATATGTAGQASYDSNYLYVCVSDNTWKRISLASW